MPQIKTERDFLEWTSGFSFYHGISRYGQYPGLHVFCADYQSAFSYELKAAIDDLNGGDHEALEAPQTIQRIIDQSNNSVCMDYDDDPVKALVKIMNKIKKYYFEVLNARTE